MTHVSRRSLFFFFFNDTATTEIYTLSLHDALPIYRDSLALYKQGNFFRVESDDELDARDRKSTRLNSSHLVISYAVFCLKKKKTISASVLPCFTCYLYQSICTHHRLSIHMYTIIAL